MDAARRSDHRGGRRHLVRHRTAGRWRSIPDPVGNAANSIRFTDCNRTRPDCLTDPDRSADAGHSAADPRDADGRCKVLSGTLEDPFTGTTILFVRGQSTSQLVQIDHVVPLSDAWQKGGQALTLERRTELANDPLNLLAVDGRANRQKGDGDAATWLPPNKAFRCEYVARQVAVKAAYQLWVTPAERDAIARVLDGCPGEPLPTG